MESTTVLPFSLARRARISTTFPAVLASKPVVGSSRKRRRGSVTSSRPSIVRFFSPPEMPRTSSVPMSESAQASRDNSRIASSTMARFASGVSAREGRRSSAENCKVSRTVSVPRSDSCCSQYPATRWKSLPGGFPSTRMREAAPSRPCLRPASASSSVDLPDPVGPITAVSSPGLFVVLV